MMRTVLTLITLLFGLLYGSGDIHAYTPTPVPAHLQSCVDQAIGELALSDGSRKSIKRLFLKYVDRDGMGRKVWRGAWKSANQAWRDKAIDLYIDTLVAVGAKAKKGASVTKVESRLADQAEHGANKGNGTWQIAFTAYLSDGRTVSAAAIVTDDCKVLELARGAWIGSSIPPSMVDAALKK